MKNEILSRRLLAKIAGNISLYATQKKKKIKIMEKVIKEAIQILAKKIYEKINKKIKKLLFKLNYLN